MTWCGQRIAERNEHPGYLPSNGIHGGDRAGWHSGIARRLHYRRHRFSVWRLCDFPQATPIFDRDPNVANDFAVTRHNRLEGVLFVWSRLTLVLINIL